MWSNMYFQPLRFPLLERMQSLSLAALSFTVALGLFFVPPSDRKDPVTPAASTAIGVIIMVLNVALVLYFVFVAVTHGREAIQRGVTVAKEQLTAARGKVASGIRAVERRIASSGLRVAMGAG